MKNFLQILFHSKGDEKIFFFLYVKAIVKRSTRVKLPNGHRGVPLRIQTCVQNRQEHAI